MSDTPFTPAPTAGKAPPNTSPPPKPPTFKPAGSSATVTLELYCTGLSATDKRVELIGAFHNTERAAQHFLDTHDNYQARFEAFCSAPA